MAAALTRSRSIGRWWKLPGFPEWFRNPQEFEERKGASALLAQDVIDEVMLDQSAKPAERLAAAKLALEIAGIVGKSKSSAEKFKDEDIANMSESDLVNYLQSKRKASNT